MKFQNYKKVITIIVLILLISAIFFNLNDFGSSYLGIKGKEVSNLRQISSQQSQERERLWNELELTCADKTNIMQLSEIIGIGVETLDIHFFDNPEVAADIIKNYMDFLPVAEEHAFAMDKTPAYFNFHSFHIPYVIKNIVPYAKLLLTLNDTVHHALTDFVHKKIMKNTSSQYIEIDNFRSTEEYLDIYIPRVKSNIGEYNEAESFAQAKETFELTKKDFLSHILKTGYYALHLRRCLETFKESEILIIDAEQLITDQGSVVEKIQDFVKLPKVLMQEDFLKDIDTGFYSYKD